MRSSNILATFRGATDAQIQEGEQWYEVARTLALGLSERYGISHEQACGVVAAISPQLSWAQNVRYADLIVRTGDAPILGLSKAKALRILAGEPCSEVFAAPKGSPNSGAKVRAFFACILSAETSEVCVDRHAYDIAVGRVTDDKTRKSLDRKGVYDEVASAYRRAARILGVAPHVVQAVTWVAWREAKVA